MAEGKLRELAEMHPESPMVRQTQTVSNQESKRSIKILSAGEDVTTDATALANAVAVVVVVGRGTLLDAPPHRIAVSSVYGNYLSIHPSTYLSSWSASSPDSQLLTSVYCIQLLPWPQGKAWEGQTVRAVLQPPRRFRGRRVTKSKELEVWHEVLRFRHGFPPHSFSE